VQHAAARVPLALSGVSSEEDDFAQVIGYDGRLIAATPQVPRRSTLSAEQLARARQGAVTLDRAPLSDLDGPVRLRAAPVSSPQGRVVVVAGAALGERDAELAKLTLLLVLGGVASLSLASLAGYWLARAALRPVEAMRVDAATIRPGESRRLARGPARDEIYALAGTLNAMLDRLQAAYLRERAFVADASHELRSPLATLRTELELAVRRSRSPRELRVAIESALEDTERLARLADDLLALARLDDGTLPVHAEPTDLRRLFETLAERRAPGARSAGVSIEIAVEGPGASTVMGDPLRLGQAVGNMLDNALREARSTVRLLARPAGEGRLRIHVLDDGPGFELNILEHAFERFVRAHRDDRSAGAGLGLAIVAAVALSHGGSAGAANLPGGGADVWIDLPSAPAGAAAGEPPPAGTAVKGVSTPPARSALRGL
jgi:signal transduction histidine kinase